MVNNSHNSNTTNATTLERRLKPIYDCLDNGSNKKAVQEADRLLKKVKNNLQCVKALKSLALLRLSKDTAANEILNEISHNQEPLDDITLQTMTICYRESSQVDKIVRLYEAACKRDPNNEELLAHLFMAHVRTCNYKEQKEIALKMYKTHQSGAYYLWAIMSLVMQARAYREQDKAAEVCLSLAEKMCRKIMDEEKTREDAIELHLNILHKLGRFEKKMFDEEYRQYLQLAQLKDHRKVTRARAMADLCLQLKMYPRAFKHHFPSLIQDYPDQLEYYQGLCKSAFLLEAEAVSQQQIPQQQQSNQEQQATSITAKAGSSLAECFDLVEKQCLLTVENSEQTQKSTKNQTSSVKNQQDLSRSSSKQNRHMLTGPFMARIELYHMVQSNESSLPDNVISQCKTQYMSKYPSLHTLLVDYFQSFSRKVSCFWDMEYLINRCQLKKDEIDVLLSDLKTWIDAECGKSISMDGSDNQERLLTSYYIKANYLALEHCFRKYEPTDDIVTRTSLAKSYIDLYDNNLYLAKNALKTDILLVDNYVILAANALLTNSISNNNSLLSDSLIMSTLVMLENAMVNSPSNHMIKLALIKLYGFIGASKISASILETLDMKHFQIDTLGHLLNPILYYCGHYEASQESLKTCSKFYSVGLRECLDSLTTSYRNCRFVQIEQITDVKDRLANSLNNKQCSILSIIVEILNVATPAEALNLANIWHSNNDMKQLSYLDRNKLWSDIRDNRDFRILRSYHSQTNKLLAERQKRSYEDELLLLQVRYHTIKCLSICYSSCLSPLTDDVNTQNMYVDNLLSSFTSLAELKTKLPTLYNDDNTKETLSYLEPESSPFRWNGTNMNDHLTLIVSLIEYYISGYKYLTGDNDAEAIASIKKNIISSLDAMSEDLESTIKKASSLLSMRQVLSALTMTIETLSIGTMVVASLTSKMQQQIIAKNEKDAGAYVSNQHRKGHHGGQRKSANSSLVKQASETGKSTNSQLSVNDLIGRLESHITKILNMLKLIDHKAIVNNENSTIKPELLSGEIASNVDIGDLRPILQQEKSASTMASVKSKLLDSYAESLKEFERILKKKMRLLRI